MVNLKNLLKTWRDVAHQLRREVERGVAIRQSAESKLSRAQVFETVADQLDRALTSSPWRPIEECGELEAGEYLVRMKRGVLEPLITIARWSGAEWQVRIVDAERYYYRTKHITHVHQMGPIRGPGETT